MQIWTEDSTVGYTYWSLINKVVFGNAFTVKKFNGNRDIEFTLESGAESKEFIAIILDDMKDNPYTDLTYRKCMEAAKRNNQEGCNILLPRNGCTERSFLTYEQLISLAGLRNPTMINEYHDIMSHSEILGNIEKSILNKYKSAENETSERRYKNLLSKLTNNTFSHIVGNEIGICWIRDCCDAAYKSCDQYEESNIVSKTLDILRRSEFGMTVNDIYDGLCAYVQRNYHVTEFDDKYKNFFQKDNIKESHIIIMAAQLLDEQSGYWNYERIYKRFRQ